MSVITLNSVQLSSAMLINSSNNLIVSLTLTEYSLRLFCSNSSICFKPLRSRFSFLTPQAFINASRAWSARI